MTISDNVQPESERLDNLQDGILYYLLNKIKHSEPGQDVQFFAEDFEGKPVNPTELAEHLEHLIRERSIEGEVESAANSQLSNGSSVLVTCKNARITADGENLVRVKYFKV
jgi:hypothetical protein